LAIITVTNLLSDEGTLANFSSGRGASVARRRALSAGSPSPKGGRPASSAYMVAPTA
jgi:hypothetical protein